MSLLGLSVEILDEIILLTVPYEIESFVLACKAIYQRATEQIQRHTKRKRRWRHLEVSRPRGARALWVLHEIHQDPLAALYVETLSLMDWARITGQSYSDPNDVPPIIDQDAAQEVRRLVTNSHIFDHGSLDPEEWWRKMEVGHVLQGALNLDEDDDPEDSDHATRYIVAFLLSTLPNLRQLQLWPAWGGFQPFTETDDDSKRIAKLLDTIVEVANLAADHHHPIGLGRLDTILPFMPSGYEARCPLQSLQPFLPHNNLRELYAVSALAVDDGYTGIPFQWRYPHQTSPLRRIELAYCCIDADGIAGLLAYTPLVEVFKYSHETKWHGCQYDWNPGAFLEAVSRHCGNTITELAITIDTVHGAIENGASTFASFPHLQHLEVDVMVFRGPPLESGQVRGMTAHIPEGQTPWSEEDIPCIGSMLPDSIVEVQIDIDFPTPDQQALNQLLKNLKEARATRLKKLERVVLRQQDSNTALAVAERTGCVLEVFSTRGVLRSMMPEWKRRFESTAGYIGSL